MVVKGFRIELGGAGTKMSDGYFHCDNCHVQVSGDKYVMNTTTVLLLKGGIFENYMKNMELYGGSWDIDDVEFLAYFGIFYFFQLPKIAKIAKEFPSSRLSTIAHHMDERWLLEAYNDTKKNKASGIDGVSAEEYQKIVPII